MASDNPLEFKGASLQLINAVLRSTDPQVLADALRAMSGGATDFFSGEPLVLDLSQAGDLPASVDWPAIIDLLRCYQLQPIGRRGRPGRDAGADAAGLVDIGDQFFARARALPKPAAAAVEPAPPPPPEPTAAPHTLIVDKPLRSGQRIYAQGTDLVVLAMVSAGAEVIADGNIHVYAPLRGRALAGATGDRQARIFTTSLQAELVSVAGIYRTFDQGLPADLAGKPAKVGLVDAAGELTLTVELLTIR